MEAWAARHTQQGGQPHADAHMPQYRVEHDSTQRTHAPRRGRGGGVAEGGVTPHVHSRAPPGPSNSGMTTMLHQHTPHAGQTHRGGHEGKRSAFCGGHTATQESLLAHTRGTHKLQAQPLTWETDGCRQSNCVGDRRPPTGRGHKPPPVSGGRRPVGCITVAATGNTQAAGTALRVGKGLTPSHDHAPTVVGVGHHGRNILGLVHGVGGVRPPC